jgi:hypothetical protein
MNKKLCDIAREAGVEIEEVYYFAELLMKECADVLDDDHYESTGYGLCALETLQKHFGFGVGHKGD